MMHVAIIGCGQLSRMLALAGIPLGFRFSFVADTPGQDTRCVDKLGDIVQWQPDENPEALFERLGRPDVVTAEKEQIDPSLLAAFEGRCAVHPNPASFALFQDRGREKQVLDELDIPNVPYVHARPAADAAAALSLPLLAKSCRDGYDGKNQQVLRTPDDVAAFDAANDASQYIIEQWTPFERELSIISVRGLDGGINHYPITENVHKDGILNYSIAPARQVSGNIQRTAQDYITRVMQATDYVGVMAMECFVVEGRLLVNEIAPRVHNSGHWTQAGCKTSQFENHLRAITGLPLGSTEHHGISGMVNLIGEGVPQHAAFSPHSTMHWYNKTARPGRKLGHVNFSGSSHDELLEQMNRFRRDALADRA